MHSMGSMSARWHNIERPAASGTCAPSGKSARSVEMQVTPDGVGEHLEPERGHRRQDPTLVGDGLVHHDVEGGDAIGRHHEEAAVARVVDVSNLARVDVR